MLDYAQSLQKGRAERKRKNDNCALCSDCRHFLHFVICSRDILAPGNNYSYQLNERGKNNPYKIIAHTETEGERERKSLEKWEGKIDEINLCRRAVKLTR